METSPKNEYSGNEVLKNKLAAIFLSTVKNGNWSAQASKRTQMHHKSISSPYAMYYIHIYLLLKPHGSFVRSDQSYSVKVLKFTSALLGSFKK